MEVNSVEVLNKYLPEKRLKVEQSTLDVTEDQLRLAKEFLDKVKPIVEARAKASKSMDDLVMLLSQVIVKLDEVIELKNVNAKQEGEVLKLLKNELLRGT